MARAQAVLAGPVSLVADRGERRGRAPRRASTAAADYGRRSGRSRRRAVEEGVKYGWRRAHKHTDRPDADAIKDQIVTGILNEVCEYFAFDEEEVR